MTTAPAHAPSKFHVQLESVRYMGFSNQELAVSLLEDHGGNLQKVVLSLMPIVKEEAQQD